MLRLAIRLRKRCILKNSLNAGPDLHPTTSVSPELGLSSIWHVCSGTKSSPAEDGKATLSSHANHNSDATP